MERYFYPSSLEEAISLLEKFDGAKPIAGGTEINLKHGDVNYLCDLGNLGLNYIKDTGDVLIGATTTIAEIADNPYTARYRALREAADYFTESVKNLATIGGNIAESVSSADMAPPLIALGARASLIGSGGERILPVQDMFLGLRRSALRRGEILREFVLPKEAMSGKWTASSYRRIGRTESDLSISGVAVRLAMKDGEIVDVGIGVGLAGPTPLKAQKTEKFLLENGAEVEKASEVLAKEIDPRSSIRASREYRIMVGKALFKRALLSCMEELR